MKSDDCLNYKNLK